MEVLPDVREVADAEGEEIARLRRCIERARATTEDKVMWHKHLFKTQIVRVRRYTQLLENDGDLLCRMFKTYLKDMMGIMQRVHNVSTERDGTVPTGLSIFQDNKAERADYIRGICTRLKLNNMHSTGGRVTLEDMEANADFFLRSKSQLVAAFGLREQGSGKKTGAAAAQDLLNQCIRMWGFTELVKDRRKRKRVNGVEVDVANYHLATQQRYEGFGL